MTGMRRVGLVVVAVLGLTLVMVPGGAPAGANAPSPAVSALSGLPPTGAAADDPKGRSDYWAARNAGVTGADYAAARAQAATLPTASALPTPTSAPGTKAAPSRPTRAVPAPTTSGPSGSAPYQTTPWTELGPAPIDGTGAGVPDAVSGAVGPVTPAGARAYSGRIAAIAVDPTTSGTSQVIYAGAAGGGVWKTTNAGGSWVPLTDAQVTLATGAIAVDASNHNTVLVGTGEPNQSGDSLYGQGVLRSTDGGATWTQEGAAQFANNFTSFAALVIDPGDHNRVWGATTRGLYLSTDNGVTWASSTITGLASNVKVDDLVSDATTNPATLYATVRSQGIFKRSSAGVWSQLTTGLPAFGALGRSQIAIAASNPNVLYELIENGGSYYSAGTYNGLYWTTDAGATWNAGVAMTSNVGGTQGWYDINLAVDPLNDSRIYVAGVDLAMATNARGTAATGGWSNLTNVYGANVTFIHPDQHALAFLPGCAAAPCPFLIGNDGGMFLEATPPANGSFSSIVDLNTNLATAQFTGGDVGPDYLNTPLALGGTQDNGTLRYSTGPAAPLEPEPWGVRLGGDGGFALIDSKNPNVMWAQQQNGYIYRSGDGGATFNYVAQPSGSLFYAPSAKDANLTDHVAWGGTSSVYETTDGTTFYQSSNAALSSGASTVTIDPNSSATIWAGTTNGSVYETTGANSGGTSTYNLKLSAGAWINAISVDPGASNRVTVGTGKFYKGYAGTVRQSADGGATWNNITNSLPATLPVNTVLTYRAGAAGATRVIVVGNDAGVFFTTDDGTTWIKLNAGLPNVAVEQLVIDKAQDTVLAYTHGRGTWMIPTLNLDRPVVPAISNVTVNEGDVVTLDATGSVSQPAGDPLSYTFTQKAGAAPTYVQTTSTSSRRFIAPRTVANAPMDLWFNVTVTDTVTAKATTTPVMVTVNNITPVASITASKVATASTTIVLRGGSIDQIEPDIIPSGTVGRQYVWAQTGGPPTALTPGTGAGFRLASVTPSAPGTYTFQLVVTDHGGTGAASVPATATVDVRAVPATGTLNGTITDAGGGALNGATVDVFTDPVAGSPIGTTTSGAGGAWTVPGLAGGVDYYVRFTDAGYGTRWAFDGLSAARARPVRVPNATVDATLTLTANLRSISGAVLNSASTAVNGLTVNLVDDSGIIASSTTAGAGAYTFTGLTAKANYRVQLAPADASYATAWVTSDGIGSSTGASGLPALFVSTTAGNAIAATTKVYLTATQLTTLAVTVKNTTNTPVTGAEVRAYNPGWTVSQRTNAAGVYTISGVRPGSNYQIWVWTKCAGCSSSALTSQWAVGVPGEQFDQSAKLADHVDLTTNQNLTFTLT